MEIFDISQTLREGMATWPGDPEFLRQQVLRIADGESSNVSALHLGTHTGTHIDAPLHVDEAGKDVTGISIQACIGPARVIQSRNENCIRAADLGSLDWQKVERVLFRTRASNDPENPFNRNFIYLHDDAAEFLAGKRIRLVGIDAPSIDPFESVDLRAHNILLRAGTVIVENLRLGHVLPGDYNLTCLPLKLAGADGSPVRAVLWR